MCSLNECIKQKSRHVINMTALISLSENYLCVFSLDTVNFLRPRLRRAATILRPLGVLMRSTNPCLFILLRLDGWNVRFIMCYLKNEGQM